MDDWHYISFYVKHYFFIFPFPNVFRNFRNCRNSVSAIPKYFSSGLLVGGTTALYAIFVFKHLLLSGHSALFLPFHTWLLEIVWIVLWLWEENDWAYIFTATLAQLYCISIKYFGYFMMFCEMVKHWTIWKL